MAARFKGAMTKRSVPILVFDRLTINVAIALSD
jgi:hypothetical protein